MVNFPVLRSLVIANYSLYPGTPETPGLQADFEVDLSVIIGTNGLGKSTLLSIAFRLLTGPVDIPGATTEGELGNARLEIKRLRPSELRSFASRVTDGAKTATATLNFSLGTKIFRVTRKLSDLSIIEWTGETTPANDESLLQLSLTRESGVSTFADWILILRYVSFYLDDRQVLFWDRSAQRQLLRSLFLSPEDAKDWSELEREVLESDSRFRNLRNVINSEEKRLSNLIPPDSPEYNNLGSTLADLTDEDASDASAQENLVNQIADLSELRASANLERLTAVQELDHLSRGYEHAKLAALSSQFPSTSSSALFIWDQLLADETCLVCESHVPAFKTELDARLAAGRCVVCDSTRVQQPQAPEIPVEIWHERSARAWQSLQGQRDAIADLDDRVNKLSDEIGEARSQLVQLEVRRTRRAQQITTVRNRLPSDHEAFIEQRSELHSMRNALEANRAALQHDASKFEAFVAMKTVQILSRAEEIKVRFDHYSKLFLLGRGELTWSPREEQIGQSSYRVKFPAYELQLGRNDTPSVSTRSGTGDVSESQKEFIDLAFRMALIEVAGSASGATILIDTPESSLDSVFSLRAADVLADFATRSKSSVIIASNLTDGKLVPEIVKGVHTRAGTYKTLNMLEVARPTPAVRELGTEYAEAYKRLTDEMSQNETAE
ncbi:hypothetical protein EDF36_3314 [Rathayibacter sp. PhB152]|uniref:hypothetical protein n=1 Tax=Rathayibacter sp. PhB152 TaxID=2485190 RepID=UPI000FA9EEE0|nr:hypothetical protein [Rathayibacter sp. PhB152]ROQ54844.1 hypothetical protein EDF36_3314 [Rathayibacter sp. PhB152]